VLFPADFGELVFKHREIRISDICFLDQGQIDDIRQRQELLIDA
jgi:hypothetical protein